MSLSEPQQEEQKSITREPINPEAVLSEIARRMAEVVCKMELLLSAGGWPDLGADPVKPAGVQSLSVVTGRGRSKRTIQVSTLWSVKDVASYLRVSPHAVYKMIERRQIPHLKVGQRVRFDPPAISGWLSRKAIREDNIYGHLPPELFGPRR